MKLKIILMFLIMLLPTAFMYSETVVGISNNTIDIKVSILQGVSKHSTVPDDVIISMFHYQTSKQYKNLDGYRWFAYDTQYSFNPNKCKDFFDNKFNESRKPDYLNNDNTNVLVADGWGWDQIECAYLTGLRNQYRNYINNGGGFVGSCGGSDFPLPLYDEPNTATEGAYTLYCSKVDVRVTYNPNPVISNPYPPSGSKCITIAPVLNITVSDPEGDTMNITWWSNSSGSWQIFGTNNSVSNGTYYQIFSNASVNGQWWYWKYNLSDGSSFVESNVLSFYTGYKSKIENTGSTNFTGYLLMQIEFYNSTNSTWILEQEVVNETSSRAINVDSVLALDTIFNPYNVSTSSFTNGDGTYRVYAAFRDSDGDVLVCDDESLMESSYQFTVSSS